MDYVMSIFGDMIGAIFHRKASDASAAMDEERVAALKKAEDDLAKAHDRIRQQRATLETLHRDGHPTAQAEHLLETMIHSAKAMEEHRRLILEQLGLYRIGEKSRG